MTGNTGKRTAVMCEGKKRFATYREASRSAKSLNFHRDKANAGVYKCPNCDKYHVGNKSGGDIRRHKTINRSQIRREIRNGRITFSDYSNEMA